MNSLIRSGGMGLMRYAGRLGFRKIRNWVKGRRNPTRTRFAKKVKRSIGYIDEYKYVDYWMGGSTVIPTGGWLACINQTAQGTAYNQRIGNAVVGKYIQIDICFVPPATNTNHLGFDYVTVTLVHDKCPLGTNDALASVKDLGVGQVGNSFKNIKDGSGRFNIVHEERSPLLMRSTDDSVAGWRCFFNYTIPERYAKSVYKGTGNAIPESGGWFLFVESLQNTGTLNLAASMMSGLSRFAFMEI